MPTEPGLSGSPIFIQDKDFNYSAIGIHNGSV